MNAINSRMDDRGSAKESNSSSESESEEEQLPIQLRHGRSTQQNSATRTPAKRSFSAASEDVTDDVFDETPTERCRVEQEYIKNGNSLQFLITLCIGIKDGDKPLIDPNDSTEKIFKGKKKGHFKPTRPMLRDEVKRRSKLMSGDSEKVQPGNWSAGTCLEWLEKNPVTAEKDIIFLKKEVLEYRNVAMQSFSINEVSTGRRWIHQLKPAIPFLRLIHCISDVDEIKSAYVRRASKKLRPELDAQKSDDRPKSWGEMLSEKWSDPTFNPKTQIRCISKDFLTEIDMSWEAAKHYQAPDPDQCESKIQDMKAMVTRIILNWEASGAGECGLATAVNYESDQDNDSVDFDDDDDSNEMPQPSNVAKQPGVQPGVRHVGHYRGFAGVAAADNRWWFCRGHNTPTYLLYAWDLFDEHDLLKTTIQILADGIGVMDGGVDDTSLDNNTIESSVRTDKKSLDTQNQTMMNAILGEIRSQTESSELAVTKRWKYEQDAKQNFLYKEMAARMEADERLVRIQEDSKRKLAIKNTIDDLKVKTVSIRARYRNGDALAEMELRGMEELIEDYKAELQQIDEKATQDREEYNTPVKSNLRRRNVGNNEDE